MIVNADNKPGDVFNPVTATCSTPALVRRAQTLAQETTTLLYSNIRILKSWKMQTNPYYGKKEPSLMQYGNQILSGSHSEKEIGESMFADRSSQCLMELMTNHGHLQLSYGWKVIEGEAFITAQLMPASD